MKNTVNTLNELRRLKSEDVPGDTKIVFCKENNSSYVWTGSGEKNGWSEIVPA